MLANQIFRGELVPDLLELEHVGSGYYLVNENEREWLVKRHEAKFIIKSVYIESLDHNFGDYYVTLYGSRQSGADFRIEGEVHPHCVGSSVCFGNAQDLAFRLLKENDIESFAGVLDKLLRSFSPTSPFGGWWTYLINCSACGGRIYGRYNTRFCRDCEAPLCPACRRKCKRTGHHYCPRYECTRLCSRAATCELYHGEQTPLVEPDIRLPYYSLRYGVMQWDDTMQRWRDRNGMFRPDPTPARAATSNETTSWATASADRVAEEFRTRREWEIGHNADTAVEF